MRESRRAPAWELCLVIAVLAACGPTKPASHRPETPPAAIDTTTAVPSATAAPVEAGPAIAPSPSRPTVVVVDQDRTLRALGDSLPAGWRILTRGDLVIVERIEPVWVLWENRASAPPSNESEADRAARIQKRGKRIHSRIIYRAESGWSQDRIRTTRAHNHAVHQRLAQLPDRHGVRRLLDASSHSKYNDPRIGASPQELPRIEAYEAERKEVEAELRSLPTFLTEHHALFPMEHEGWSDGHHIVHPYAVVEECYRLDDAIRKLLAEKGTRVER